MERIIPQALDFLPSFYSREENLGGRLFCWYDRLKSWTSYFIYTILFYYWSSTIFSSVISIIRKVFQVIVKTFRIDGLSRSFHPRQTRGWKLHAVTLSTCSHEPRNTRQKFVLRKQRRTRIYRTGYGLVACDWPQFIPLARRLEASGSHESARVNDHRLRGVARLLVFVIMRARFEFRPECRTLLTINVYFSPRLREREREKDWFIERINSLDRASSKWIFVWSIGVVGDESIARSRWLKFRKRRGTERESSMEKKKEKLSSHIFGLIVCGCTCIIFISRR